LSRTDFIQPTTSFAVRIDHPSRLSSLLVPSSRQDPSQPRTKHPSHASLLIIYSSPAANRPFRSRGPTPLYKRDVQIVPTMCRSNGHAHYLHRRFCVRCEVHAGSIDMTGRHWLVSSHLQSCQCSSSRFHFLACHVTKSLVSSGLDPVSRVYIYLHPSPHGGTSLSTAMDGPVVYTKNRQLRYRWLWSGGTRNIEATEPWRGRGGTKNGN
jgi:hypothetical protein